MDQQKVKYFKLSVGKLKRESPRDISCCCPACGDKGNRLHLFEPGSGIEETGGIVKCFNGGCQFEPGVSVLNFLKDINSPYVTAYQRATLGRQVEELKEEAGLQSLLEKINAKAKETLETLETPLKHHNQKEIPLDGLFEKCTSSELCMDYLKKRKVESYGNQWYYSTQKFFTLKVEGNDKTVFLEDYLLIPIINDQGKFRGFYSRSVKEKRFSTFLLPGATKIWLRNPLVKPDIITEGIFDALSTGYLNSAAMIGADLEKDYVLGLPKKTIFAFDNDKTGHRKAIKYSKMGFDVFVWPVDQEAKDFNELEDSKSKVEINKMIKANIYRGIQAEARIRMLE